MTDTIDYGTLMHRAMRSLISDVLTDVGQNGLPGDHHFFVTYDTTNPRIGMPDWLVERYPDEITIVIQHWFDDLIVEEDGFHITLNFGDQPVPLFVPFDAIQTFVDPSVEFGLRFESQESEDIAEAELAVVDEDDIVPQDADVVSLDSFRK